MRVKVLQAIGVLGTAACIVLFALQPSFPTPDKIFVFLVFVFMAFRHAKQLVLRLLPFIGLLLVYETFRGLVPHLNHRVEYLWMIRADEWLFGSLPTRTLQNWWWHGQVQWYDIGLYLFYMLHFVLPIGLALLIWQRREKYYWRYVTSFTVVSFAGFITFLAFPAAPPWMAAQEQLIEPITRISSQVWFALGVHDFPSVYNKISPNPVAAVPSLHAAFATLFAIYVFKLFGKKWGLLSLVYPLAIYVGTVYQGEHYAIDEIIGAFYGVLAYYVTEKYFGSGLARRHVQAINRQLKKPWPPSNH